MKEKYRIYCPLSFLILITIFLESCAQTIPDPDLVEQIAKIKAIDNCSYMSPATANQGTEEEPADLPGQPPFDFPVNLRFDNPHWIGAWRDLYGYKYNHMEKEHLSLVFKEKQRIKQTGRLSFPRYKESAATLAEWASTNFRSYSRRNPYNVPNRGGIIMHGTALELKLCASQMGVFRFQRKIHIPPLRERVLWYVAKEG